MGSSKKANTYFQFKQFIVHQDQCAMKVGTDGVLLGAWTPVKPNDKILDIGTGTGLIALMLAQKDKTTQIRAIDINEDAVLQAQGNVILSPFESSQIQVEHISLDKFDLLNYFDLIVSNPPYFNNSLQGMDEKRNLARHTDSLSLDLLFTKVSKMLCLGGRFCMIYPVQDESLVEQIAFSKGLNIAKKMTVYPTSKSVAKRVVWEFQKTDIAQSPLVYDMIIEEDRHIYTDAFRSIVKGYYLNL